MTGCCRADQIKRIDTADRVNKSQNILQINDRKIISNGAL